MRNILILKFANFDYILLVLQHFATKPSQLTNFMKPFCERFRLSGLYGNLNHNANCQMLHSVRSVEAVGSILVFRDNIMSFNIALKYG